MKSDLLCQEASASSPAAPSWGKRGKQPEEKHISAGSSCPSAAPAAPAVPNAAGHSKRRGEHRARCRRAGPSGFAWAAAKDQAALANQTRHQALPPGETLEDFFSLSFAGDAWSRHEPPVPRSSPRPAPRVLLVGASLTGSLGLRPTAAAPRGRWKASTLISGK